MQIQIQDRAEVSLRSLRKPEQTKIARTLNKLAETQPASLYRNAKLLKLGSEFPHKKMYIYKGDQKLRLIISVEGDTYTLEDIIDSDRLNYLIPTLQE
jgi:mRNA-degrading endonuclease RelE of RelBE toxin-antitoxin system